MGMTTYVAEIREQPQALATLLEHDPARQVASLDVSRFRRVILSGMGASHYATHPAWLILVQAGVPAWWIETGELLHHARELIGPDTLLWLTSQSGYSAEITTLLTTHGARRPRRLVALTNDPGSPLALAADLPVEIHAGHEEAVSTKSYVNSLVAAQLLALSLVGAEDPRPDLERTIAGMDEFLGVACDRNLEAVAEALGEPRQLVTLARGEALHAAWTGALILKEAARCPAEGMSAGQFRHGPLELAGPDLTAILLEGSGDTAALNRGLAEDLVQAGAHVLWIGAHAPVRARHLPGPPAQGIGVRVAEIVPLQLMTIAMARLRGVDPGEFQYSSKVTVRE